MNSHHIYSPLDASRRNFLFTLLLLAVAFFAFAHTGFAADSAVNAGAVFTNQGTTDADTNIIKGMNTVVWWIYTVLKLFALAVAGYASLELRRGEITQGVFGWIAAICMFLAPSIVELAQKIGQAASGH